MPDGISRIHLDRDALREAMFFAHETSHQEAVDRFIEHHPELIDYRVTGRPCLPCTDTGTKSPANVRGFSCCLYPRYRRTCA